MKRASNMIFALVTAVALLAGCEGSAGSQIHTDQMIAIGANLELSGTAGDSGSAVQQGIQLALDQVNEAGGLHGRQLELVALNNQTDSARAVTLATTLSTQHKAVAVIGPTQAWIFNAAASVTNVQQIPNIAPLATSGSALQSPSGALFQYAYRSCLGDPGQGAGLATFAAKKLAARNALVIRDEAAVWTNEIADGFATAFASGGGTVVDDLAYQPGAEAGPLVDAAQSKSFDVIMLAGYVNEAAPIVKALRDRGINAPILGTDSFGLPRLSEVAGLQSAIYYPTQYSDQDSANPRVASFAENFRAAYGQEPNAAAALGYDSMMLVADAIARSETVSGVAVAASLAATNRFEGVTGMYSFNNRHEPVKPLLVIELTDGQPSMLHRSE